MGGVAHARAAPPRRRAPSFDPPRPLSQPYPPPPPPTQHTTHTHTKTNQAGDYAALLAEPKAAAWLLGELTLVGKADKLKGFEMVKAVHLEGEAFSVDNDCLTPSFKLKRPQLQKRYQAQLDAMYVGL